MPYRDVFKEIEYLDPSPKVVAKLLGKSLEQSAQGKEEGKFYHGVVVPLLLSTKKFLDQTATEPPFRVFQSVRSPADKAAIKKDITQQIQSTTEFLKELGESDPRRVVTASAIKFCVNCVRSRLNETEGAMAHEPVSGKYRS